MQGSLQGQSRAQAVISRIIDEKIFGRTVILLGGRGCGKFTAAVRMAGKILLQDPFLSMDFIFYRNDSFSVKTRYFLKNISGEKIRSAFPCYLNYLLGRLSTAISLGETTNIKLKKISGDSTAYSVNDFRNELSGIINSGSYFNLIENSKAFSENLILVSDELSKKLRIPIDFIRRAIEFNGIKSESGHKITLIGNFENATEETQNASLKLFEEPPAGNLVILSANSSNTILPTILSRSMIIHFNPLTPALVSEILGTEAISAGDYFSTSDLMEDDLFRFHEERKKKVIEFFTSVAPVIQQGNSVFSFIDKVVSDENIKAPVHFFNELIEFIRNAHLMRQEYLRKTDLSGFIDEDYKNILRPVIQSVYTSELREFAARISFIENKIRYNNVTPAVVLPGLCIDLARWYQKVLKKKSRH